MKRLSLGDLAGQELRAVRVDLSSSGDHVFVAELSGDERDEMELEWEDVREEESAAGFRAFAIAFCLCDENRKFDFPTTDDRKKAFNALGSAKARRLSRIFNACSSINGLTKLDVDQLEKNLETATSAAGNGE